MCIKQRGGSTVNIDSSNLTHENNTVIYTATKQYTGDKIAHWAIGVGYVDK